MHLSFFCDTTPQLANDDQAGLYIRQCRAEWRKGRDAEEIAMCHGTFGMYMTIPNPHSMPSEFRIL